jgi:choline dehydrogenase-like flavoprotein
VVEKHYGNNPDGELSVETSDWHPLREYFYEAGEELGFQKKDLNGPQSMGIGAIERTQMRGQRCDTFSAFLKGILNRPNLTVSRYSQVLKVEGLHQFVHMASTFNTLIVI